MSGRWPDDERMERPTVCRDTFDRRDQSSLDARSSKVQTVLTCQNFERAKNTQQHSRLIHIIDILSKDSGVIEFLSDHGKPMCDFIIDVMIMPAPV
jgi:hypothetical protein